MDKAKDPGLFVNDGSFMERFKQLQQEKEKKVELLEKPRSGPSTFLETKVKTCCTPIKFGEDEDEDEDEGDTGNSPGRGSVKRPKLAQLDASDQSSRLADVDYKYYEYRLNEEQKALSQTRDSQVSQSGITTPNSAAGYQRAQHQQLKYQTPASALYEATENIGSSHASSQTTGRHGESIATTGSDPIAMMEYYMKKAAEEEKLRPPKPSKDEMPPPASLQVPMKKGHHMGDYIPPEELEKFLATCNDVSAQKVAQEAADKAKIQADNVGHRLLSKMGWKEGEGLGTSRSGIATPIMQEMLKRITWVSAHTLQARLLPKMTSMSSIRSG
ncbi:UNVERIFIED_CONTAM: SURP and G-patch domain-containing protein 1-like protein [Sesamum calycinum]|uniref:SURP and G-patch domain-containing protein 1-like protein n=1 Tax=Sesamum calycinum TaxID=2727403 RepID=A0AAW2NRR7_9LAMI